MMIIQKSPTTWDLGKNTLALCRIGCGATGVFTLARCGTGTCVSCFGCIGVGLALILLSTWNNGEKHP